MKHLVAIGLLVTFGSAQAVVLYDNGPVVDGAGLSILNSGVHSTLGVGSSATATVADNFSVVGPDWNVEGLDFYAYQTGATSYTFTGATWSVRLGTDVNTATVLASGTDATTNGGLVGYRVTSTTLTNTQRPIFRISVDIPDLILGAGDYFVTWALAGTLASGPFVPPVIGSYGITDGAKQSVAGAFIPVQDGASLETFDLPFTVNGSLAAAVPEPGTFALLGVALAGLAFSRRRKLH